MKHALVDRRAHTQLLRESLTALRDLVSSLSFDSFLILNFNLSFVMIIMVNKEVAAVILHTILSLYISHYTVFVMTLFAYSCRCYS